MAVSSIEYEEPYPETYREVELAWGEGLCERTIFGSGDFVKDWFKLKEFIATEPRLDGEFHFSNSSSVDHFIMDGAKFDSAYLYIEDDVPFLSKEYKEGESYGEFFIPEGKDMTWGELKEYSK